MNLLKRMLKNVIMEKIIWICLKIFMYSYNLPRGDYLKDMEINRKKNVKKN